MAHPRLYHPRTQTIRNAPNRRYASLPRLLRIRAKEPSFRHNGIPARRLETRATTSQCRNRLRKHQIARTHRVGTKTKTNQTHTTRTLHQRRLANTTSYAHSQRTSKNQNPYQQRDAHTPTLKHTRLPHLLKKHHILVLEHIEVVPERTITP